MSEEQYHVLPLYTLDTTDENGHVDLAHENYHLSMSNKIKNGAIEVSCFHELYFFQKLDIR